MTRHTVVDVIDLGEVTSAAPVDPDVVTLDEAGDSDDLPRHAVRQADGSFHLPLMFPVTLKFRNGAGETVREESFDHLHLHRMTGADMRAISAASAGSRIVVSIARSARMSEGKMGPLFDRMDAADANAAGQVVGFLVSAGGKTGR